MEPGLEDRLQSTSKEQLVLLLQELATRHPTLLLEMTEVLEKLTAIMNAENEAEVEDQASGDWDFGGNELAVLHASLQPVLPVLDIEAHRQRIQRYPARLTEKEGARSIADDLQSLLQEARRRAGQNDYTGALEIYALVLDQRLEACDSTLTLIFDQAIDAAMPDMEALLSEASSNVVFDPSAPLTALTPLLTSTARRNWLERLFALWLKRLDAYHADEKVPEMILDIAWSDDVAFLRRLAERKLQPRQGEHPNIVDLRQYRMRAVDKFLRELPYF
jgi:hypothetical protein